MHNGSRRASVAQVDITNVGRSIVVANR